MSDANVADVGPDPAGPIDDAGPLDDARQLRPEGRRERRHDLRHRLGVGGLGRAQLRGRQRARARGRAAPTAMRSTAGQSTRPRRAARSACAPDDGRRGAEGRPDEEAGLPDPVVAPGRAAAGRSVGHRAGHRELDAPTSGNAAPNSRAARAWNGSGSPVVSWQVGRGRGRPAPRAR